MNKEPKNTAKPGDPIWDSRNGDEPGDTPEPTGQSGEKITDAQQVAGRRLLLSLPADEAELVYRTGAAWAASSTARKNRASAAESPRATRRSSLAVLVEGDERYCEVAARRLSQGVLDFGRPA